MASFFLVVIVFCLYNLSSARDTLLPGEFLYPNQSLMSINGMFKFGFIDDSSDGNYSVGIWLTSDETENSELPLVASQTDNVVWTANTNNPITKVSVSQYGTLVLIQSQSPVWSSDNLQNKSNCNSNCTKLVLHDTGNLILQDQRNETDVIWQSFYHPTNTWLPGAWLGYGTINGEKIGSLSLTSGDRSSLCL
ncbi:G-type lectin S-receptor-like serine/threonine-protein kinase At1g67520 [Carex rostrata]